MQSVVIDIGNTSTTLGLYDSGKISDVARVPSHLNDPGETINQLDQYNPSQVALACVNPKFQLRWERLLKRNGFDELFWIDHTCELGLPLDYPKPEQIGADRLANAAAAAAFIGLPTIVCDFGTALTFDIVDARKGYCGGVICPGLPLMFDYLAEKTALLPALKVEAQEEKKMPIIGRSTEEAMRAGALLGYRGMVREVLGALQKKMGKRKVHLRATGGHAGWILQGSDIKMKIDYDLTLKGIGRIYEHHVCR